MAKPDRIVQEFVDALGNSNCDYELGATWPDADELECTDKDRDKSEQETLSSPHFPPQGASSKGLLVISLVILNLKELFHYLKRC